ncbi:MAG: hypothetical protein HOV67_18660 [Kribbellaceae bacterium]|nr:hypothetical protein [Catenulispora sp.]NUR97267.1 hypothetical protein [Kribbellaceae bacterium]
MNAFAEELLQRIATARQALHDARDDDDLDAERIYLGELDSLLRLAMENGITVHEDAD